MSELANRLRDAAWSEMRSFSRYHRPEGQRATVDRTVAAVLRELGRHGVPGVMRRDSDGDWVSLAGIRSVAEVVERGEQQ